MPELDAIPTRLSIRIAIAPVLQRVGHSQERRPTVGIDTRTGICLMNDDCRRGCVASISQSGIQLMAISVTCDECSETHRVKDDAVGKTFKCKGCGKSLKVKAPAPPEDEFADFDDAEIEDDDSDDAAYSRKKAPKRAAAPRTSAGKSVKPKSVPIRRTKVPLGVDCVFFGFVLTCLVIFAVFAVTWSNRGNRLQVIPILYWLSLVGLAATVLTAFGKLLCLTAPPQMSGRGSIFVAVGIDVLSLSITVASFVTTVPPLLRGAVNLLAIAGFVCFIVFLQNLGDLLGERDLRERGSGVLKMGIGIVVLYAVFFVLALLAATRALPALVAGLGMMLLGIVLLISGIIFVIRYGGLLLASRYALSNA
jgi:hypothetical protein